ncbi:hypothetical protein EC99P2_00033 [Enterococcus phage EC99P2]|nr:hypothetical protein EC99P2_00033 [Enterococcus phage EC99P2]
MKLLVEITPLQAAEYLENGKYKASEVYVDRGGTINTLERQGVELMSFHKHTYFVRTEINIATFDTFHQALRNLNTLLGGEQ